MLGWPLDLWSEYNCTIPVLTAVAVFRPRRSDSLRTPCFALGPCLVLSPVGGRIRVSHGYDAFEIVFSCSAAVASDRIELMATVVGV